MSDINRSAGFRRLALATGLATFALILVGGVVRVSGSGLGCGPAGSGFNGWPFCNGDVVPGLDLNAVIEYTHRVLAAAVGVMMIALAVLAVRHYRGHRGLVRASVAAAGLVIAQGLLGAATVEGDLDELLVASHLGLAMGLLALILYVWRESREPAAVEPARPPRPSEPRVRAMSVAASVLVFCTIVAGGYMAGTQNYGRADYQLGDGAHHACGKEFPTCNGGFMPFGEARLVDIHLAHRFFMYLAVIAVSALALMALRRGHKRAAHLLIGLLATQVLLGALNVWLDEYELLILAHLTLGTLLWAASMNLVFQLYATRATAPAGARRRPVAA
ncbi:MAG: COX15/CtaA family protein [Actinomycetota bacterium]|nr:COX15/CtaA family protein [Actinomycetota bacterium]